MTAANAVAKPMRAVGGFYSMALDTLVAMFKPPFAWREFILQTWFVARVSIVPTLMLSIPFTVLLTFIETILLTEFGAADFSGTGAALGAVTQIGPIVTVLVVAGAGATAMCADLGARTIRDELDALRVMGINPDPGAGGTPGAGRHRRVAGAVRHRDPCRAGWRLLLRRSSSSTSRPGAFAAGLTLFIGAADMVIALVKAALFGLVGRSDRLLQGHFGPWRPAGCRQRGQRNRRVHLHGAVRDQRRRDRRRRQDDAVTTAEPDSQFPWLNSRVPRRGRRLEPDRDADQVLRQDPALDRATRSSTTGSRSFGSSRR